MRVIIQRVLNAHVKIKSDVVGNINQGLLVLVGFSDNDDENTVIKMCEKLLNLRIFSDDKGKMNLSLIDISGEMLIVSNFTLYGNADKGNRPNFSNAGRPDLAATLYQYMIENLKRSGLNIQSGEFGAMMEVTLTNDGPVTLIIDKE
ncbi:MAG: D-aminoacyl-tRNA deacylase [Candidatus Kapaibacterium sp.]